MASATGPRDGDGGAGTEGRSGSMTAPAAAARRTVSSAARAARACGQFSTATERGGAIVRPASASLVAQAGPAWAILIASRARVAWVTVTVTKPGPVTSAVAIH